MNPANVHTHTLIHTVYFLLFYMLCVRDINYNYVDVYTHTHPVHTPCIISLFDALALKLIGMLESVTAYIITMMEMSLSGCVL